MNLDSYKVLKLINGEMIICEINSDTDQSYEIENPLQMDVRPKITQKGRITETLLLSPWLQNYSEEKYFNIDKSHCLTVSTASVGLSRYYEYVITRMDDDYDHEENEMDWGPDEPDEEDIYDELLMHEKPSSKLIH